MTVARNTLVAFAAACAFAFAPQVVAQQSGQPALATEKDRVSYAIGVDIARSLKNISGEIDPAVLQRAIGEALAGKQRLGDDEVAQVLQAFGQRMQAKQAEERKAVNDRNVAAGEAFLAQNGRKPGVITTPSGLQYQVLVPGAGAKPTASSTVRAHYVGTLLDGTKFDSSHDRGEPGTFGVSMVVPGWTEALQLMPVGSKYKLWIPSKLGYGEQGTPGGPIPPGSLLVFEVELVEVL
ncbi:MAG: FKBP-type peptidyl-prolyl cis-trans isomerase [Pseudomonadota bacterium]